MAYTSILFKNPITGEMKEAPVGFSWTVFFFNFFPPLFRSDWKWAFIMFLCAIFTWGASVLVFMFIYNKLYIKDLIGAGFKAKSKRSLSGVDLSYVSAKIGTEIPLLEEEEK
tara:strand:+ start:214 stop:549 length:336 start_codon:yes stop_codon:yes gene_type:complete